MLFFTADHHFYHANIIRYCKRPFQSVEEMNDEMFKRWNEFVSPSDTVYYLGDFSLARRPVELFLPRLNGEKHLIMGNHDLCHPLHKKRAERYVEVYMSLGFKSLTLDASIEIAGRNVYLNHMPYQNAEHIEYENLETTKGATPRYNQFRPIDDGRVLLHGHVHEKWKINKNMINVGVDVWNFYPVPVTEIEQMIKILF